MLIIERVIITVIIKSMIIKALFIIIYFLFQEVLILEDHDKVTDSPGQFLA